METNVTYDGSFGTFLFYKGTKRSMGKTRIKRVLEPYEITRVQNGAFQKRCFRTL